jgi:hypothetical protein
MDTSSARASLRVIKSAENKRAKAAKYNYASFAAVAVLAVALILLGLRFPVTCWNCTAPQ